jgi:hypothetical protein
LVIRRSAVVAIRVILAGFPVVVGVEPVGVAGVPVELGLGLRLAGEIRTIEVSVISTATTTVVAIGVGFASYPIVVRVEVVGAARVAIEHALGFLLGVEVAAVVLVLGHGRAHKQERIDNPTRGDNKQRGDSVHDSSRS